MISFIIIGRNVEHTISKCLTSIIKAIELNSIIDYEVIYIDSNSNDSTIDIVKTFDVVKSFQITGVYNAAIARNVGFQESKGDSLLFLGGDMELVSGFFKLIFDDKDHLKYDYVSGDVINEFYSSKFEYLNFNAPLYKKKLEEDRISYICGGLFAIKRSVWIGIGGMRSYYKRSQDLDLALRLSRKGSPVLMKKDMMAIHHTVSYFEKDRLKKLISSGAFLYSGVLFRDHIFNKYAMGIWRNNITAFFLVISAFLMIVHSVYWFMLYLGLIFIRSVGNKQTQGKGLPFYKHMLVYFVRDLYFLFAFAFYYPRGIKKYKYKSV